MRLRESLQKEKEELQKAFQTIKDEQQDSIKIGLGVTYSRKEALFLYVFGVLFGLGGLLPLTVAIIGIFYPFESTAMTIFVWSVALIFEVVGVTTAIHFTRKILQRHNDLLENEILNRATSNNGIVKEQEFYIRPFSRWRSKRMINKLLKDGTIEIKEFTPDGDIYLFPRVISEKEKQKAKGVFEI